MPSITIHTNPDNDRRNVTLWLNQDNTVSLLGNLPHGTIVVVDQKLVNDLQRLVNKIEKGKQT